MDTEDSAHDLPDDADGDALRKLARAGSDLTKPMTVDFAIAAPSGSAARSIAEAVSELGFAVNIFHNEETDRVSCYCSKEMIPTYDALIRIQVQLDEVSRPFGGYSDGWGSFGNGPRDASE